jgi:hypothetical protein
MNKRLNNIEFRWSKANKLFELVRWVEGCYKPYCYTIAFFRRGSESFFIESVGSRLLQAVDNCSDTIKVWRYAETVLRAEFVIDEV